MVLNDGWFFDLSIHLISDIGSYRGRGYRGVPRRNCMLYSFLRVFMCRDDTHIYGTITFTAHILIDRVVYLATKNLYISFWTYILTIYLFFYSNNFYILRHWRLWTLFKGISCQVYYIPPPSLHFESVNMKTFY